MAKPRRRSANCETFPLYLPPSPLGYTVHDWVTVREGDRLVVNGTAEIQYDGLGFPVGYRLKPVAAGAKIQNGADARPVPVMLTVREMDLIAGQKFRRGRSRTAGRTELQRLSRVHPLTKKALPPEDEVERAVAKLHALTPRHLQLAASARM